jgi:alpha-D-ribose 1-methylphosphonate 5-phosphate C-P lyase
VPDVSRETERACALCGAADVVLARSSKQQFRELVCANSNSCQVRRRQQAKANRSTP